jgi:hypothetical protein
VLPWLLVPLAAAVHAEAVVAASVAVIALFVALNEINVRRMRARLAAEKRADPWRGRHPHSYRWWDSNPHALSDKAF